MTKNLSIFKRAGLFRGDAGTKCLLIFQMAYIILIYKCLLSLSLQCSIVILILVLGVGSLLEVGCIADFLGNMLPPFSWLKGVG